MHAVRMLREIRVARANARVVIPAALERLDAPRLRVLPQPRLARQTNRVAKRLVGACRISERIEANAPELERRERRARIAPVVGADLVEEARRGPPIALRRRFLRLVEELLRGRWRRMSPR